MSEKSQIEYKEWFEKIIDWPREVGGWPDLPVISRPDNWDTDQDGMPDKWERKHKLDPNNPKDRNDDRNNDGYTNLEEYLNSLTGRN